MHVVVDTNVPKTANGVDTPQASPRCIAGCNRTLAEIRSGHILVLDDGWAILREYMGQLNSSGQPGPGDAFLRWILLNQANPRSVAQVAITPNLNTASFDEFPQDPALLGFDPSDHKFVAVALTHPRRPPIYNATDSDWWNYHAALAAHNLRIEFVCPDLVPGSVQS